MVTQDTLLWLLGIGIVAIPFGLLAFLGIFSLLERPVPERMIGIVVPAAMLSGLLASLAIAGMMVVTGQHKIAIEVGDWVVIPHYHFSIKLLFDRLSLPFVILAFALCGTIGAFANRYLHREPGFNRFMVAFALFVLGMTLTSLAGTIETLFAGWELVGLSSALLVAFFHERLMPVRNGLRVWVVYRVSDAALLWAAVVLHHLRGEGDFEGLLGVLPWPDGAAALTSHQALLVGSLLLLAAAGKSALVPFSGWLPRAMEGPTPSSAVFYGALSVHLGAYLLLRVSPILDQSPIVRAIVVAVGLITALYAALVARVQTDIKSALSFASLTQVGIIVAEIGLGLRYWALAHIIGHACLRTLQFLRAPSLLRDYHAMENAMGARLPRWSEAWYASVPVSAKLWLYRLAIERGYLDAWLSDYVARPFLRLFTLCDELERKWTDFLAGGQSRESDLLHHTQSQLDDVV